MSHKPPKNKTKYPIKDHTQTFAFKLYLLESVVLQRINKCYIENDNNRCNDLKNDYNWIKDEVENHPEFTDNNTRYQNAVAVNGRIRIYNFNHIKETNEYKDLLKEHNKIKNNESIANINNQLDMIHSSSTVPKNIRAAAYILEGDAELYDFINGESSKSGGSRKSKTRKSKTRKSKTRKSKTRKH